jgi:hypothetical protein
MHRAFYEQWRHRIWLAETPAQLMTLYYELGALPPSPERSRLVLIWGMRWARVAPGQLPSQPWPPRRSLLTLEYRSRARSGEVRALEWLQHRLGVPA